MPGSTHRPSKLCQLKLVLLTWRAKGPLFSPSLSASLPESSAASCLRISLGRYFTRASNPFRGLPEQGDAVCTELLSPSLSALPASLSASSCLKESLRRYFVIAPKEICSLSMSGRRKQFFKGCAIACHENVLGPSLHESFVEDSQILRGYTASAVLRAERPLNGAYLRLSRGTKGSIFMRQHPAGDLENR